LPLRLDKHYDDYCLWRLRHNTGLFVIACDNAKRLRKERRDDLSAVAD
jgi:hypothetical protein